VYPFPSICPFFYQKDYPTMNMLMRSAKYRQVNRALSPASTFREQQSFSGSIDWAVKSDF
jgi:hypothetical protein